MGCTPTMTTTPFNDIWSRLDNSLACGFCAAEVEIETEKCPHCRRRLYFSVFRYPRPSSNFYIFLILLFALVQLVMIQVILDLLTGQDSATLFWHGLFMPIFAVLTVLVFWRFIWAYYAALIALVLAGLQVGIQRLAPEVFGSSVLGTPLAALYTGFGLAVSQVVFWLLADCLVLAFLIGLIWVAPDFARDRIWYWLELPAEMRTAGGPTVHLAAVRYAEKGLWGIAVAHWRRAIAAEPGRILYFLHLIDGYRRLGFKARALDALDMAEDIAGTAEARAKLAELRLLTERLPG